MTISPTTASARARAGDEAGPPSIMFDDDDSPEPAIGPGKGHPSARRSDHLRACDRREHEAGAGKAAVTPCTEADQRAPVDRQLEIARRRGAAGGHGCGFCGGGQRGGKVCRAQDGAGQRGQLAPQGRDVIKPFHQPIKDRALPQPAPARARPP